MNMTSRNTFIALTALLLPPLAAVKAEPLPSFFRRMGSG